MSTYDNDDGELVDCPRSVRVTKRLGIDQAAQMRMVGFEYNAITGEVSYPNSSAAEVAEYLKGEGIETKPILIRQIKLGV